MKIGIDIDGVIFDSETEFKVKAELYDVIELNENNIVDEKEPYFQQKYGWSEDIINDFTRKKRSCVSETCNFMPGAIEVINLLKKDGHELIVITARGEEYQEKSIAQKRFKEEGLEFDKCYWEAHNKSQICKAEKIDIMIDDYYKNCKSISENNIKTLYFREYPNYELEENKYLKEVHNWGEIYRYIKEIGGNNAR